MQVQRYIRGKSAAKIGEGIEAAIRDGALRAGSLLPTVRGLADELGVSPTTVAASYKNLASRGVVVSEGRRGTRVSLAPPVPVAPAAPLPARIRDLSAGNPDPALLPRLGPFLEKLGREDAEPDLYGGVTRDPELLDLASKRLRAEGLRADSLSVVSGALDGIERVLQARLRPGDRVAVEDPGFGGVLHLVRALGLTLVPFALDDEGPDPDSLAGALRRGASALIVTPRAQNPTGAALSAARARELRRLVREHPDLLIVEDDHAAEVAGAPAQSLVTRDSAHFAIVRSVSKALGPDLRTAILSGDAETVARVEGRQLLGLRWVSHVLQRLVVALWRDKAVARDLKRAATTYTERREALIEALAEHGIDAHGSSGMNVWVPVEAEAPVLQGLFEAGWAAGPGERYRIESGPAVRITTATLEPAEAPRLAAVLAACAGPRAAAHLA
jgi:DNA-binding transcriptional MocR family regulator